MSAYHRNLADIHWCLHSCPLVQIAGDASWPDEAWFRQLPAPEAFSFTPPDTHRLGIRFERLLHTWIDQEPTFELLAANLPVRDASRTLGEFDLIVQHLDKTEHWELAVKFYLNVGDSHDAHRFFGPNPTDTLARKISHLQAHQLRLTEQPAARSLLAASGWQIDAVRSFVKGRLFYPLATWRDGEIAPPAMTHPHHETGWWCTVDSFRTDPAFRKGAFTVLSKSFWLAPISANDTVKVLSAADLELDRLQTGVLHVAQLDTSGDEIARGFIVSSGWLASI